MTNPIKIFVCHKKNLISNQSGQSVEQSNLKAALLHQALSSRPELYDPWIDAGALLGGMQWEHTIYRQLLNSDVLIVAVGEGTSQSEWVRREIALAKAIGLGIFPLGYDLNKSLFVEELKALGIDTIHGLLTNFLEFGKEKALIDEIHPSIAFARDTTVEQQRDVVSALNRRINPPAIKAKDEQQAYSTTVTLGTHQIALHVAAGDIAATRGIDVLVNSENNFMQMARVFETRTVSATLRRLGSSIGPGGVYTDTIQQELDQQLSTWPRPVRPGQVFVTSTGGPHSDLFRIIRSRYIFHVASVEAVESEARVVPFKQPYQIEACVRNCLSTLHEINQAVYSNESTETLDPEVLTTSDSAAAKLNRSILFPVFGTGQGGGLIDDAIQPMLRGIVSYFNEPEGQDLASQLSDIYFSAYTKRNVDSLAFHLQKFFDPQVAGS